MRTHLSLPQLESFLKLAEIGSFRDAAAALGVSQPALSRTISKIEGRIGTRLFDRHTRHISLTPTGERLRPMADRLLKEYENSFLQLSDFVEGREGLVRIASLPSLASTVLAPAITHFQELYPGVQFDIWEDVGEPVHHAIENHSADIGLAPPPQQSGNLHYKPTIADDIVLVCRKDDPLALQDVHNWSVFAERPFICTSHESGLRMMFDNALTQAGIAAKPSFTCKHPSTVGSFVTASLGIAPLTRLTMEQIKCQDITWRRLHNPAVARSIGIITYVGRTLSPAAQLFLRVLDMQARQLAAAQNSAGSDA